MNFESSELGWDLFLHDHWGEHDCFFSHKVEYDAVAHAFIEFLLKAFSEPTAAQRAARDEMAELEAKKAQKAYENEKFIDGLKHYLEKGYFPIKIPDIEDVHVDEFYQGFACIRYKPNMYSQETEFGWIDIYGKELKMGYRNAFRFTELGIAAFITKDYCLGVINTDGNELFIDTPPNLDWMGNIKFHDYNGTICSDAAIKEYDARGHFSSKAVLIDINGNIIYTAKEGHYIKWDRINKDKISKIDEFFKRNSIFGFIDYIPTKIDEPVKETTIII